jgi:hypothetical protein
VLADDPPGTLGALGREDRLLLLASLDETFGLEPLEHLACGCARDAQHLGDARGDRGRSCRGSILPDREGEEVDRLEVLVDAVPGVPCHAVILIGRAEFPRVPP